MACCCCASYCCGRLLWLSRCQHSLAIQVALLAESMPTFATVKDTSFAARVGPGRALTDTSSKSDAERAGSRCSVMTLPHRAAPR
jgi:hypothetical protein